MKRTLTLIACVAVCCAMMVSCKNTKTVEPTPEEIKAQKVALADSVLAEIDAFADECITATVNGIHFREFELSEKEKQVKPEYLLDPAEANKFVTKSQKVNALAIYIVEFGVRELYGMPMEETKEAIIKLAAEVNFPFDFEKRVANTPISEFVKEAYEKCKNNGDLALFWQIENVMVADIFYVLSNNPELFFCKISDEQWKNFNQRKSVRRNAIRELAKYDEEIAAQLEFFTKHKMTKSDEEMIAINSSIESAKQFYIANKENFIATRNDLLQ